MSTSMTTTTTTTTTHPSESLRRNRSILTSAEYYAFHDAWEKRVAPSSTPIPREFCTFGVREGMRAVGRRAGVYFGTGLWAESLSDVKPPPNTARRIAGPTRLVWDAHEGVVVALLDEFLGRSFGDSCVTTKLRVKFPRPERWTVDRDAWFDGVMSVRESQNKPGQRVATASAVVRESSDEMSGVWASASAVFVQTPEMRRSADEYRAAVARTGGPVITDEALRFRDIRFGNLAPVLERGTRPDDPASSFYLVWPPNADISNPSKLSESLEMLVGGMSEPFLPTKARVDPANALRGRVVFSDVAVSRDGNTVVGVVRTLLTAEGGGGNAHGGALAAAYLEVLFTALRRAVPLADVEITFRRIVPVTSVVAVRWTRSTSNASQWHAEALLVRLTNFSTTSPSIPALDDEACQEVDLVFSEAGSARAAL